LYITPNGNTSTLSDDPVCLLCDSCTPVHYCTFFGIAVNISQYLSSLLKAPTLVKVSRLCASFLRTACSHVADQVSRQTCWTGLL
jgi:hypothetical protein